MNPAGRPAAAVPAVALLLAMAGVPAPAAAQRVEGSFDRTLSVSGPADLEIVSGSGRVDVRSGSTGQVQVVARIVAREDRGFGSSSLSPEERVRRLEANPPIEQTGNRIRIGRIDDDELSRNVSISYTVTVPADTSVVSNTGSGAQQIEGVRGRIEARSGSGSIRIRDAGADVQATTGSGSIEADSVRGAFEARSGSGSILGSRVGGAISARSGSGRIEVTQTGQGDVEATSGSGSVSLSGVRGAVRASTASGSLRVDGEQTSDWRLSTASGSIVVDLAGTPGFELDARSNSGGISTDFPVTVRGTVGRRELRGSVNGGGPVLYVRTASGGITIR